MSMSELNPCLPSFRRPPYTLHVHDDEKPLYRWSDAMWDALEDDSSNLVVLPSTLHFSPALQ